MPTFLKRACAELGLEIITPYDLKIDEKTSIRYDVLLPQLGGKKGMLVTCDASLASEELIGPDYGFSSYDVYSVRGNFDVERYKIMFSDWGWTSAESEKPDWMT